MTVERFKVIVKVEKTGLEVYSRSFDYVEEADAYYAALLDLKEQFGGNFSIDGIKKETLDTLFYEKKHFRI